MPESSGSDQSTRNEVAPPLVTSKPVQRTGYAVLAASGLVLATAFGGIAELAQPDSAAKGELASSPDSGPPRGGHGAPGKPDGDRTRTIDGVAVAEAMPGKSTSAARSRTSSPSTIVTFGPNGQPTTTTIAPHSSSERSSRHDDGSGHSSTGPGSSDPGGDTGTTDPGNTDTSSPSDSTSPTGSDDPTETEPSTPTETTRPTGSSSSATSNDQSSGPSGGPNTAP